ncbi:hypothetical protein Lal_00026944 [Lupinus albus]|uniref:Putative ribosomal protein L34Ae n=1 Tax=Lupinus albus TaxID=3870 RepID=A0A6A4Q179_LUPAL|nr:putative ribosomal protein L34Ae [Lupinus albus]KAF1862411.1 hypothetical protein Lal_00026944 [Lupinus albus]
MGAKNLVMLKAHIESINIWFMSDLVIGNVPWVLVSLQVFFLNYVLYSFGFILRYIFSFQVENKSDRNGFQNSEINGLAEELTNLLFCEDFPMEYQEMERETECSVSKEKNSNTYHYGKESDADKEGFKKIDKTITEYSVLVENFTDFHEDVREVDENETEYSFSMEFDSNIHQDYEKKVEFLEEETKGHVVIDTYPAITTSKCKFLLGKDISDFIEEPTTLTFSFLEFYKGSNVPSVSDNAFSITEKNSIKELSEGLVAEEEKEYVQEQRSFNSSPFSFGSETEVFSESDSDSESSNSSCEGIDYTSARVIKEGREEEETQFSSDIKVSYGEEACIDSLVRTDETLPENKFNEKDCTEDDDDDDGYEWEDDEAMEQVKLELRNARQGGLATIIEEEEEKEEKEAIKVVEPLKPLKIEEKVEYKDHIVEIQKVYKCYAQKMRKLDILNYQTMHAIGLLQLKDPPKIILMPKSTVQSGKPIISQNLWPRKAPKQISDPMLKFVQELHRDLELVYVGQVCNSWEILCWQHKKSQELKQFDSQWPHRYNLVADEFQLFQVLMQRFIENEPFQGPRIQNYAKNRGFIRNLIQVPSIKDNTMKDKKTTKWGSDKDAIESGRLEEIINESMRVFWEFVRADKVSHEIRSDVKDQEILDLVMEIRTQLHKKERKLKEIVRGENCIVKRFQKHHEDQILLDHKHLLAQVGLKLISRVVNMKNLRKDQLIWCTEKLNRIKFFGRKIEVETSFLFFPC